MDTQVIEDVEFAEPAAPAMNAGALAEIDHTQPRHIQRVPAVEQGGGFMPMLAKVVESGNFDLVEKMMTAQERWEANEARKAFNNALALAKAEIKPVSKNRHVGFDGKDAGSTRVDYNHEDLAGIADSIDAILANHGLFYRWIPANDFDKGMVTITCRVSHRLGHSEDFALSSKVDAGAGKNHLQAVGSAVTYLERYTLKAALGLASKHDDDGRAAGATPVRENASKRAGPASETASTAEVATGDVISLDQMTVLQDLIVERGVNSVPFFNWVRRAAPGVKTLSDIPVEFYDACVAEIKNRFPPKKGSK